MGRARLRVSTARFGVAAALAVAGALVAPASARAQATMSAPLPLGGPQLTDPASEARPPVPRPRLSAAVGMAATFDGVGFGDAGTRTLPAFIGAGGVGDGLWGFDFFAYASSGIGRSRKYDPVDRLGLDLLGVVRPAARVRPEDRRYGYRVLRTLAGELGLGLERVGRAMSSGSRFVVHAGARVELPLTPEGGSSELRVRLGVRRDLGLYTPTIKGSAAGELTEVHDTVAELYAALVLVF
jgi:hypothetical protein